MIVVIDLEREPRLIRCEDTPVAQAEQGPIANQKQDRSYL